MTSVSLSRIRNVYNLPSIVIRNIFNYDSSNERVGFYVSLSPHQVAIVVTPHLKNLK